MFERGWGGGKGKRSNNLLIFSPCVLVSLDSCIYSQFFSLSLLMSFSLSFFLSFVQNFILFLSFLILVEYFLFLVPLFFCVNIFRCHMRQAASFVNLCCFFRKEYSCSWILNLELFFCCEEKGRERRRGKKS